jgi:hypothetical protein
MALSLRPLSIGEMLDRTFGIYRDHFKIFVGIFVFPQLAVLVAAFGFQVILHTVMSTPAQAPVAALGFLAYSPIYFAVIMVALAVGQAATIHAVSQVYLERPATISDSYSFIRGRFWSILGVVVLILIAGMVAAVVGVIALLIGALIFPVLVTLYSALAVPVTVLEGRDPIESLKRSYNLVKDDLGRIFVIWLLFVVVQIAASTLVSAPTIVVAMMMAKQWHGQAPLWFSVVGDVGQFVVGCLVKPLLTIAFSVVYYDERVRKEALDMQFMMATIDRGAMAAAASGAGVSPSA